MIDRRCSALGWFWHSDSRGGGDNRTSDFKLNGRNQFKCHREANKNQTLFFSAVSVCETVRFGLSDWQKRQTEKRVCNANGSFKKRAENNCTTVWVCVSSDHQLDKRSRLLTSQSPAPFIRSAAADVTLVWKSRRLIHMCVCHSVKAAGAIIHRPSHAKKKRKTGLCGDLCESYLSVPETKPETLNPPPPSSKRSGPRHHLAVAALCVQTNPDVQKSAGTVRACALSCTLNAFCQKVFYKPSRIMWRKAAA